MENAETLKAIIKEYRRKVDDASDDIAKGQRQLVDHERKLDSLENYQQDSLQGYQALDDSPFTHARRREYKLLLDRLDIVVAEQAASVKGCIDYIERTTVTFTKFEERLQRYRSQLKALTESSVAEDPNSMDALRNKYDKKEEKEDAYVWLKTGKF